MDPDTYSDCERRGTPVLNAFITPRGGAVLAALIAALIGTASIMTGIVQAGYNDDPLPKWVNHTKKYDPIVGHFRRISLAMLIVRGLQLKFVIFMIRAIIIKCITRFTMFWMYITPVVAIVTLIHGIISAVVFLRLINRRLPNVHLHASTMIVWSLALFLAELCCLVVVERWRQSIVYGVAATSQIQLYNPSMDPPPTANPAA